MLPGFGIMVACLLAGETLKTALGLILPGNILGLFILLALLASGIVPLRWVEAAGRWLLFLLPLLFVPIFVVALKKAVQLPQGTGYFAAVFCGVILLWASVGHLAQRMLSRRETPLEPGKDSAFASDSCFLRRDAYDTADLTGEFDPLECDHHRQLFCIARKVFLRWRSPLSCILV